MSPRDELPAPVVRRRSRAGRLAPWLVAVLAAAAAAWYGARHFRKLGPTVTVAFDDGTGLSKDALVVRRGIEIGKVRALSLDKDERRALVTIRLTRDAADFAREGAVYWLVKPRLSEGGLGGLNALATGPYIEARPGDGEKKTDFDGLSEEPKKPGVEITLVASRFEGLSPGAPVSFRGIQVGDVREVRLSEGGDAAEARAVVWTRYAPLVRGGTKFWTVSGFEVQGGLLKGIRLKLESVRQLASGGVAFATPEKDAGAPARDGARFPVADKPKKDWLSWAPKLPIAAASSGGEKTGPGNVLLPTGQDLKQSKTRGR